MTYAFGPYRLDTRRRTVSLDGTDLAFGAKVVETLLALIERAGETCSAQQLLDRIWPEGFADPAGLRQNIYVLRRTLREHWDAPVIETVRHAGYRFAAPLQTIEPETDAAFQRPALKRARPAVRWSALAACALFVIAMLQYSTGPARGTATGLSAQDARLYALGRYYWNKRTREGVLKSVNYFRRVVRSEPGNALGYSGLADAYVVIADYGFGDQSAQTYHEWERRNVERAFALDPNLSEVRTSRAKLFELVDRDLPAARADFVRAIELNPNNAVAHLWYGVMLARQGRTAQARAEFEIAEQIDPTAPAVSRWLAITDYLNRRYDSAITYYRQTLELNPDDSDAALMLGLAYEASRAYAAALHNFRRLEKLCNCPTPFALEARTLALMGRPEQARARLVAAQSAARKQELDPLAMAAALIALGQRDQAMKWLRSYPRSDYFEVVWLHLDQRLDAVRNDPRFNALLGGPSTASCGASC